MPGSVKRSKSVFVSMIAPACEACPRLAVEHVTLVQSTKPAGSALTGIVPSVVARTLKIDSGIALNHVDGLVHDVAHDDVLDRDIFDRVPVVADIEECDAGGRRRVRVDAHVGARVLRRRSAARRTTRSTGPGRCRYATPV